MRFWARRAVVLTDRAALRSGARVIAEFCRARGLRRRLVCGGVDGSRAWSAALWAAALEQEKGMEWMPWHQEAMKDVARCDKPRGAASRR